MMKASRKKSDPGPAPLPTGGLFARLLLHWNENSNQRQMPWKGEKDPYRIWLSEVILQQTRVEQGLKYYQNFITHYPTVEALAAAPADDVFRLWEGLGYYSRCRNLLAAARFIADENKGEFPKSYADILQLKGVGPYTAAAIASFAYNLPHAVLDGNVFRVLARIYHVFTPIDSTEGKKEFGRLAQQTMPPQQAGVYNQAIMDFGATVCKPVPDCAACFYQPHCPAFRQSTQKDLPVKSKQLQVRERWFHYFVLRHGHRVAIRQRTARDIWQQLFEFPLIETSGPLAAGEVETLLQQTFAVSGRFSSAAVHQSSQRLTHQLIHFSFYEVDVQEPVAGEEWSWVSEDRLEQKAFPKTIKAFIRQRLRLQGGSWQ